MNASIKAELKSHLLATVQESFDVGTTDFSELHFKAFNEDYYIVGSYQAEQWIKSHDVSAFTAIQEIMEWEMAALGENTLNASDINAERIVNLYVYVMGEELLSGLPGFIDLDDTSIDELSGAVAEL